ncbi:hypothetical protein FRX31_008391 [Thalictrum thalictroides]|uniref:Uncharacterized protein n=1 Tax=Thalictrum thalictroides TaxID=46969 RepID=A0A7J6WY72_THATH|nr:hypothetical protein FRX31_008391 [Thalictrum thalictroides]
MAFVEIHGGRKVLVEKSFRMVFKDLLIRPFFRKEIRIRGWKNILVRKSDKWHPTIVDIFYSNLNVRNDGTTFVTYLGMEYELEHKSISDALDIPILQNPHLQNPIHDILHIAPKITIEGKVNRGSSCIDFKSLKRNQAMVAYWLGYNVLGTSKPTGINRTIAHILWQLQTKNRNFCIVRILYNTLTSAKRVALRVLITKIWRSVWKLPTPEGDYIAPKRMILSKAIRLQCV